MITVMAGMVLLGAGAARASNAPLNLEARLVSCTGIEVEWDANPDFDAARYVVTRYRNGNVFDEQFETTSTIFEDSADRGLVPDREYWYRVYGLEGDGDESSESYSDAVRTGTGIPTDLEAGYTGSAVELEWVDNADFEDFFIIERKIGDGQYDYYEDIGTVGEDKRYYIDESLEEGGVTYHYRVKASGYGGDCESEFSQPVDVAVPFAGPLNLTVTALSCDLIELQWEDSSERESAYIIEKEVNDRYGETITLDRDEEYYLDTNVCGGNDYEYTVIAIVEGDDETYAIAEASTDYCGIDNLYAVAVSDEEIRLTFDININYEDENVIVRIERDSEESGEIEWEEEVDDIYRGEATVIDDRDIEEGVVYSYRLELYIPCLDEFSDPYRVTAALPETPPEAPSDLIGTPVSWSEVKLDWTDNSNNEEKFVVERTNPDGTTETRDADPNTTSCYDSGLTGGTTYSYRVRAYNYLGYSEPSNVTIETTLEDQRPDAPSNLTAQVNGTDVILQWDDNSDNEESFFLQRRAESSNYQTIAEVPGGDGSTVTYTDDSAGYATFYTYRVYAANGDGSSSYSNTVTAVTEDQWDPEDDSSDGATLIAPGDSVQSQGPHTLGSQDSYDRFKCYLQKGVSYLFYSTSGSGDLSASLYVKTPKRSPTLATDEGSGDDGQFTLLFRPRYTMYYYLKVATDPTGGSGKYTLKYVID